KARLDRVNAVVQSALAVDNTNRLLNHVLIDDTNTKLHGQMSERLARETDWSSKFGTNNQAVVNLPTQISQVRSAMLDELRRLAESSKSDYDLALKKQNNLETQVAQAVSQSETSNRAKVTLRELKSTAAATKDLYDNLNKRYMESVEQKSFPVTEARVITRAVRPLDRE